MTVGASSPMTVAKSILFYSWLSSLGFFGIFLTLRGWTLAEIGFALNIGTCAPVVGVQPCAKYSPAAFNSPCELRCLISLFDFFSAYPFESYLCFGVVFFLLVCLYPCQSWVSWALFEFPISSVDGFTAATAASSRWLMRLWVLMKTVSLCWFITSFFEWDLLTMDFESRWMIWFFPSICLWLREIRPSSRLASLWSIIIVPCPPGLGGFGDGALLFSLPSWVWLSVPDFYDARGQVISVFEPFTWFLALRPRLDSLTFFPHCAKGKS